MHSKIAGLLITVMLMAGDAAEVAGQQPAGDSSYFVEAAGARLYVREVGHGIPLVVLHGGPGLSHDYLAPQLVDLLADEYRLIFYDQRGSGRSSGASDTTRLTLEQFVEDLELIRRALSFETLNLLGHSFGGLLAMKYASAHPTKVAKLVLLDSDAASWDLRTPYQQKVIAERLTEEDSRILEEIESQDGYGLDPEALQRYFRVFLQTYMFDRSKVDDLHLPFTRQSVANHAVTSRIVRQNLGRYDIHSSLSNVKAPTLLIHGRESVFSVEGAAAIQAAIPLARLIVLDDVGHFAYIEDPHGFRTAVRAFVW